MAAFLPVCMVLLPMLAAFPAAVLSGRAAKSEKTGTENARKPRPFLLPTLIVCALEALLALLSFLSPEDSVTFSSLGIEGLSLARGGFAGLYALIASFMWTVSTLFSGRYFAHEGVSRRYVFFWLFTLGATVGLFLSRDLGSAFLFFELLSLSSYTWVVEEGTPEAFSAGKTYLAVAVLGGMILFMGIAMLRSLTGTLDFSELRDACASCERQTALRAAGLCILLGFGAKAGMFPLHIWLPKAHPVAPSPASAILSGTLTKAGIFGMILLVSRIFAGSAPFGKVILLLGAVTMVLGALLALAATNLKRTLACSSVSQIGFIMVGLGCGQILSSLSGGEEAATLAFAGALLHAVNHSSIKLALFLCAGVVASEAGSLRFDDIRGFGRKKPGFALLFLFGCLAIGGVPLFGGYLSKTLLHEGIVELSALTGQGVCRALEWVFLCSGGMTVCYMSKLFTVLFIDRPDAGAPVKPPFGGRLRLGAQANAALGLCGAFLFAMCLLPTHRLIVGKAASFFLLTEEQQALLPQILTGGVLFSGESLLGACVSLGIGALLFVVVVLGVMRRKSGYRALLPGWADAETLLWRPLIKGGLWVLRTLSRLFSLFDRAILPGALGLLRGISAVFEFFKGSVLLLGLSFLRLLAVLFEFADGTLLALSGWFNPRRVARPSPIRRLEDRIGRTAEKRLHLPNVSRRLERGRRTLKETMGGITRTLAFTMCMTCVGLCLVFVYMLLFAA